MINIQVSILEALHLCNNDLYPVTSPVVGAYQDDLGRAMGVLPEGHLCHEIAEVTGVQEALGGKGVTERDHRLPVKVRSPR